MKWILFSLSLTLLASGAFVGSAAATAEPAEAAPSQEAQKPEDEDFIPTDKVPAGSAVSFPVDI